MHPFVTAIDWVAVAVFAVSGALVASRKEMDIVGFGLIACLTGIGGGTLRDVLLDRAVFWTVDPTPMVICLAIAVIVFFTAHIVDRRYPYLLWADAIGVAIYGVMGAELARLEGAGMLVSIVMGMMTATFGGLIRDVVCNETPLILRKEVYVTCAALAAAAHIVLIAVGVPVIHAAAAGIVLGFGLRALGIWKGLSLPTYKSRPGRDY
ncbi:trimeric intracellular cation channel family protein [Hwanghaeella sp.]|uniref:trimeric intracellular cation channel family protein n=1 Tax=Hwanghaeella sp. TaxID=2605943 RepID=UPI003CCBFAFF